MKSDDGPIQSVFNGMFEKKISKKKFQKRSQNGGRAFARVRRVATPAARGTCGRAGRPTWPAWRCCCPSRGPWPSCRSTGTAGSTAHQRSSLFFCKHSFERHDLVNNIPQLFVAKSGLSLSLQRSIICLKIAQPFIRGFPL